MFVYFFFFQAEDGIRDLVRSRGLGDVYKRQDQKDQEFQTVTLYTNRVTKVVQGGKKMKFQAMVAAVSYTHLTLPTIYSV